MKQKILIIDDEPAYLESIQTIVQSRGYATDSVTSARDGLDLARQGSHHLILIDVNLADGDGFDLLKTLRCESSTATIPVVLMTGVSSKDRVREAMKLGADDFLEKPISPKWLLDTVEAQIQKREKILKLADQTKNRLVSILEATPDLVGILDAKSLTVVYLNRAGRRVMGWSRMDQITSRHLEEFYPPESFQEIRDVVLPAAQKEGTWRSEAILSGINRHPIPVSQLIQAHNGSGGEVEFYSIVAHDLTEQKAAEKERHRVEIQLRHAQKLESIGQLAAGIAHEINTPTQFIGDNIRFLQDAFNDLDGLFAQFDKLMDGVRDAGCLPELVQETENAMAQADLTYLREEVPKAIEQSLTGVSRISKIVQAMKEFSHPGTDEMTAIDLNHAIESTATVCRNEWKYVAQLDLDLDPALPPVTCLPGEFNQVVLNLVVNAAHAIAEVLGRNSELKGTITISTRRKGDWVEIRIRDTGTGIPASAQERIFDPFFTTKPVGKGTGQGLSIARSVIVDKHGGAIHFETEKGRGTTFIIGLPIEGCPARKKETA